MTQYVRKEAADFDKVKEGLTFLLGLCQPGLIWPRTISTNRLNGAQIAVYNLKEALEQYELSLGLDCRLNAYPNYTKEYQSHDSYKSTVRLGYGIFADVLSMDIDLGAFRDESTLKSVLFEVLDRIDEKFHQKCKPAIVWSGGGYHIYQPVQLSGPSWCLAHTDIFHELGGREVDRIFLQWVEGFLTNGHADPNHGKGLSFNNCLMRVPGTINTKKSCPSGKEEVRIIQRWDGKRSDVNWLLRDFRDYLIEQKSGRRTKGKGKGRGATPTDGNGFLSNAFSTVWRRN
jgi:hypothetical protein